MQVEPARALWDSEVVSEFESFSATRIVASPVRGPDASAESTSIAEAVIDASGTSTLWRPKSSESPANGSSREPESTGGAGISLEAIVSALGGAIGWSSACG